MTVDPVKRRTARRLAIVAGYCLALLIGLPLLGGWALSIVVLAVFLHWDWLIYRSDDARAARAERKRWFGYKSRRRLRKTGLGS